MNLHTLIIHASSDAEPNIIQTFRWVHGDPMLDLQGAINQLQSWINDRDDASKAASATRPIETET